MKKTIEVTLEDVRHGMYRNPWYCPVALASQRVLGESCRASIDFISVKGIQIDTPADVKRRIRIYDSLKTMDPFSFELDLPDSLVEYLEND